MCGEAWIATCHLKLFINAQRAVDLWDAEQTYRKALARIGPVDAA